MYGIPIGDSRFVKHKLSLKLEEVAREVEQVLTVLQGEGQAIWSVIRSSTIMKLDYHLALCYPSDMAEAAAEMDQLLHNMVEACMSISWKAKAQKQRVLGAYPRVCVQMLRTCFSLANQTYSLSG